MSDRPGIPAHLAGRPQQGGLVVPWITPVARGGVYLFGQLTDLMVYRCLTERRCQICGAPLPDRTVLFARESDLTNECTSEPGVCPPCAAYSARACPMLNGQQDHYRAGAHPALPESAPTPGELLRRDAPAETWHTVWVGDYDVVAHPTVPGVLAASWQRIPPLRIRPLHHPA